MPFISSGVIKSFLIEWVATISYHASFILVQRIIEEKACDHPHVNMML
jgi:hypothetical protein